MVMQPTADFFVDGLNLGSANMAAALPKTVNQPGLHKQSTRKLHRTWTNQDSNCRPKTLQFAALPFDRGLM